MTSVADASPQLTGQPVQRTLQQPKPKPPKRPYASFLDDFVNPVYPDRRAASVHTFVSEWLESVGSDREKRCRSDSHLQRSDGDSISRQLTRSAPEMGDTRGTDGFAVPPTPASTGSRSRRPSIADNYSQLSASTPASSSVRHRMYRQNNLEFNHIYVKHPAAALPDAVYSHVNDTLHAERDSPELSSDEMRQTMYQLDALAAGCDEDDVAAFLNDKLFPNPKSDPSYGPDTGLTDCMDIQGTQA
ncbi:hypothetical protein N0V84_009533 [Fusarium piperis]|uniref:Uncharacterized protein n=1 Tax=Fusarium piperis TaxID=1435070 RepID=A0A9W9BHZ6_9HYPO|nr:hypothetical protein N0V84_009533 [Fusarium piperis]